MIEGRRERCRAGREAQATVSYVMGDTTHSFGNNETKPQQTNNGTFNEQHAEGLSRVEEGRDVFEDDRPIH
jgi:hypothetical protein